MTKKILSLSMLMCLLFVFASCNESDTVAPDIQLPFGADEEFTEEELEKSDFEFLPAPDDFFDFDNSVGLDGFDNFLDAIANGSIARFKYVNGSFDILYVLNEELTRDGQAVYDISWITNNRGITGEIGVVFKIFRKSFERTPIGISKVQYGAYATNLYFIPGRHNEHEWNEKPGKILIPRDGKVYEYYSHYLDANGNFLYEPYPYWRYQKEKDGSIGYYDRDYTNTVVFLKKFQIVRK